MSTQCSSLLDPSSRLEFIEEIAEQYEEIREDHYGSLTDRNYLPLEAARQKRFSWDWTANPPPGNLLLVSRNARHLSLCLKNTDAARPVVMHSNLPLTHAAAEAASRCTAVSLVHRGLYDAQRCLPDVQQFHLCATVALMHGGLADAQNLSFMCGCLSDAQKSL